MVSEAVREAMREAFREAYKEAYKEEFKALAKPVYIAPETVEIHEYFEDKTPDIEDKSLWSEDFKTPIVLASLKDAGSLSEERGTCDKHALVYDESLGRYIQDDNYWKCKAAGEIPDIEDLRKEEMALAHTKPLDERIDDFIEGQTSFGQLVGQDVQIDTDNPLNTILRDPSGTMEKIVENLQVKFPELFSPLGDIKAFFEKYGKWLLIGGVGFAALIALGYGLTPIAAIAGTLDKAGATDVSKSIVKKVVK